MRKIPKKIKNLIKSKQKSENNTGSIDEKNKFESISANDIVSKNFQIIEKFGKYSLIVSSTSVDNTVVYPHRKTPIYIFNNNQNVKNITSYCETNEKCKYVLLATVALKGIEGKYRRDIKFDGGAP